MELETLRQKLESIVGTSLSIKELTKSQTESFFCHDQDLIMESIINEGEVWFPAYLSGGRMTVLSGVLNELSLEEVQFMELLLATVRDHRNHPLTRKDRDEQQALELGDWLHSQLGSEEPEMELPEELAIKSKLTNDMVCILLRSESANTSDINYSRLKRLLLSYFDGDMLLIPLEEGAWLVMARKELVAGSIDDKDVEQVSTDYEQLSAFCLGLYELIANEWVGVFHLSITVASDPVQGLPVTVHMLRETIQLGRTFNITEHIHLPWELSLEALVNSIPAKHQLRFLERMGDPSGLFTEPETLSTLETFFQLDCNVSETAKRLYIHRNTLLYRLDKIKQETGLDVRSFKDAVLVKLTMLLYKVTKRK